MIPTTFDLQNRFQSDVQIKVEGGQKTDPSGSSEISDEAFQQALTEAINKSGIFSKVVASNGDYDLNITIIAVVKPDFAFNMNVSMAANWKIIRANDNEVLFNEIISKPYTANFNSAFTGIARLRIAVEGAGQENIKEGIARLSRLKL
jgi:hypothetical protein